VSNRISRRGFLAGTAAAGAAAAMPLDLLLRAASAAAAANAHFFTAAEYATCDALCSRILPADADPGAGEARAVDFIDLFLAAFELPASVADHPAIWLNGRFTGRNPYGDKATGQPSSTTPAGDLVDAATGQKHFLPLNRLQERSWRAQLYGAKAITDDASLPAAYRDAVRKGLIKIPPPLRDVYRAGLAGYDQFAGARHGVSFVGATTAQQDAMVDASGASAFGTSNSVTAPAAVAALYPVILNHTLHACFALPEYGGNRGGALWKVIRYDGDTQPLGNSIYDENLSDDQVGANQGHNAGFGDAAVFQPRGGYREYRPVSVADPGAADPAVEKALIDLFGTNQ
jgi:hypothetical protein